MPWQQRQRFLRWRHIAQENRRILTKTRLSLSPARWQVGHGLHQLGRMLRLRPLLERTKIGQMCASGKVSQVESSFCLSPEIAPHTRHASKHLRWFLVLPRHWGPLLGPQMASMIRPLLEVSSLVAERRGSLNLIRTLMYFIFVAQVLGSRQ